MIKKAIILASLLFCLVFVGIAHAQTGDSALDAFAQKSGYATASPESNSIETIVSKAISWGLSLIAILFLGMLMFAGLRWMTARGNEELVKKAKDTIEAAVTGLIIISLAYAITSFIFARLSESSGSQPPASEQK